MVQKIYVDTIEPVVTGPKLITGNDLIKEFGLTPGPTFGRIMSELEIARIDGVVTDRNEALSWINDFLLQENNGEDQHIQDEEVH